MKRHINLLVLVLLLSSSPLFAQFNINAELRTRAELNNGLLTLPVENSEAALYVTQRSRLDLKYKNDKFTSLISLQDVRFWGENDIATKSGIQASSMGFGVSEAWFNWNFSGNWGLKTGRQVWNYDDGRLLSIRNWNQHGLAYDAFLLHFDKDNFQFHIGSSINNTWALFNKEEFIPAENPYEKPIGYRIKYLNFIWMKFQVSQKFSISLSEYLSNYLAANTNSTLYSLATTALHFNYHTDNTQVLANVFYQYGSKASDSKENAYMFTMSWKQKFNKIEAGLGADYMTGDSKKTGAFDIMYGARHKYNGWMNYYVIPKSTKDGGLVELNANIKWSINKQHSVYASFHQFWMETDSYNYIDGADYSYLNNNLGNELDLNYTYKYNKSFNIQAFFGYYFATETTEFVKSIPKGSSTSPYWASMMLTFKPQLFKTEIKN